MSTFRLLCFILWGSTLMAAAQGSPLMIKKIRYSLENAPSYVISGGQKPQSGNDSAQKWVVIEVEFDTSAPWITEATFDTYVLVKSPAGGQPANLQGTATYQDIEKGQAHRVAMFMSPQTYRQFTGTATQQAIEDVAVKVTIGGAMADMYSDKFGRRTNKRWWEAIAPKASILRAINDTPWYPLYYGVYEQLKPTS